MQPRFNGTTTLIPLFGIILYGLLYLTAVWLYPGGSQADKTAIGFSFVHNYWCELFREIAYNGLPNPARPVAITAMLLMCPSIGLLWFWLPRLFEKDDAKSIFLYKIIQYSGVFAMCVTLFLFTQWHDAVINVAGYIGSISIFCFLWALYQHRKYGLLLMGVLCLFLSSCNYLVYQSGIGLYFLPILQKITFLLCFLWAAWIDIAIYRRGV
jgi:hypothetical protein